jgi:hypothetical protein
MQGIEGKAAFGADRFPFIIDDRIPARMLLEAILIRKQQKGHVKAM